MVVKVTFTVDDETVLRLRRIAARLAKPQSQVVREALKEYEVRSTKLSDEERARMLAVVDRMMKDRRQEQRDHHTGRFGPGHDPQRHADAGLGARPDLGPPGYLAACRRAHGAPPLGP